MPMRRLGIIWFIILSVSEGAKHAIGFYCLSLSFLIMPGLCSAEDVGVYSLSCASNR